MTSMEFHSPFKLQMVIHGAENLPIADFTTSDPYVTITIGGRLEGRTKTIYRHRNPTWNELFNLKLLHRRSVVILKVFDEDRGQDDDLLGTTIINLAEISLDQTVQKKYPVIGYGDYDTKLSKLEISVTLRSNESVITVVPDDGEVAGPAEECLTPQTPLSTASSLESSMIDIMEQIVKNNTSSPPAESVVNAITRFITRDKNIFFSEDLLKDLLDDASSLTKSITEATTQHRVSTKPYFNRTALRIINSSKIILATKTCHWHPPLPKNTIQLSLCANDSKFLSIEFCNRLAMWVFTRWIFLLTDFWTGKIKPSELPIWSNNCIYSTHCAVHVSDGHYVAGRLVLAMERPFELRVNDEHLSFKGLHNIILSADSLLPKTDILDVEVVTYSATGEDEDAIATEAVKKGMFQSVRQGIRGTLKGVATGAVSVVSGAADAAVITTLGVANTTVGAARSLVAGKPLNAFHAAQDNLFSVGKDIRSILKDATAALGGEASTYLAAKFDNIVQKVHKADHFYVDCNQDTFQARSMGALRRSSFGLMHTPENPEHIAVAAYPDIERSSSSLSMLLCHGNDAAQMVVGHKRVSAQWLREKVGQNTELRLDTHLGFSITLLHSRGLQLTPPGKITIGGGGMHVKMKFTDKNGNSRTLGRLQEVKTQSITPNANPDWKEFNVVFKAQDGFEDAAFLRVEICLDDFTTNFVVGTCFIPLVLFRKKSKEVTMPMTRYKLGAVHPRDASVHNCLGETTMRIYRIEEGCGCPALMRFRTSHFPSNLFNTRWFSECVPAGTVNTDNLREVEAFSMLPAQEGLELVSVDYMGSIHAQDAVETAPVPESSKGSPNTNEADHPGPVDGSFALTEDWSQDAVEVVPHITMIEVYENQRRQPYYPFDWSSKAYTRPLYSDESFNVGYKFDDIKNAAPPQGCSWVSEWCLDRKYVETDDNGWNYGLAFRTILSNQKKGKSHTKPLNMMARRRKWVRKVITNDKSTFTGRNAMQEFEQSNCTKQSHNTSMHWGSRHSLHDSASSHGGEASPSKATHPVLDAKLTGWRNEFLAHFPHALVAVCQERLTAHSSVLIPWEQVKDAFVITPSVLSVYIHINRYFPDKGGFFRHAEVEIFVTNCPAAELKSMIDERKWFTPFKAKIRNLVASGTTTGLVDELEDRISETEDYVPDTEELSLGSVLVADLDQNSILLEAELRKIDKLIGKHNSSVDRAATKEKAILLRRDCRLRVYMAALFGVGLRGNHQFVDSEIRSIMERDFKLSEKIKQQTEVATANNRIEFYLDTAEKRIRDAVLCGWSYRGGQLERCLEIFANGYFIEIVGLLGTFFEDTGIDQVKGLGSKVELINTYMVHNDRLATILDHALRPYALRAQPAATLSLFLDFDILVSWYTSVLLLEMRERVNDVLAVWKDRSKDVTGLASEYKYPVPWIPQYSERGDAQFFTAIPEDLVEVLVTYLQHARIHKETVAPSFAASVGRLDVEVLMAYSSSFLYLAEQMYAAMKIKEWAAATAEEELSEYATWLCSLANDARRVETERLHSPNRVADAAAKEGDKFETEGNSKETVKQEEAIERRTLKAFRGVTLTALDHMCCIIFLYVFHDRMNMLSDELYKAWNDSVFTGDTDADKHLIPIIPSIMEDVSLFLQDKAASLNSYCYWKLVGFATDKVCVLYFSLFKIAHRYGGAFAEIESKQIRADVACMRDTMHAVLAASLLRGAEYTALQSAIHEKFTPLDLCCDLLDHGVASVEFDNTMKKLQALAHKQPIDAAPLASLIETFLGLKGVSKYAPRKKTTIVPRKSHSVHSTPPPPIAKGHTQHPTVPPAVAVSGTPGQAAKRRGSMFDYFRHGGHTPEPTSTPIVSPTTTTVVSQQQSNNNSTASAASIEEEDEEDEDVIEMRLAQQMREQALIECIGMSLQLIRSQSIGNNISKSSALSKSTPLERVFGTDLASEYDLNVQILHSACPPSGSHTATSTSSYFSLGGAFKGLFGKRTQKVVPPRLRNFDHTPGSPTTPSSDDNGAAAGQITVSSLRAEDLFYLDTLRNPHPYLKIEFGKFTATTKVLVTDTTADWSTEEPIVIPLRGIGTSETARTSVAELTISLYYKGYFTDQVIGSIVVEFAPYAPPHFTDRRVVIKDFQSPQAILAAKRAKDEGRNYPSIILSLAPDEVVVVQNPAVPAPPEEDSP